MIKDPNCKNKHWKGPELEAKVDAQIRELLRSPEMAAEIAAHKPVTAPAPENTSIEKRIREIDRQINKLMGLYQNDEIPTELLGENINRLYNEKTALQSTLAPVEEPTDTPFDLFQELIADAAQVWDFADEAQRRRITQSLISRIILTDDDVKIEWAF